MSCYERFLDSINKAMTKICAADSSCDKDRQLTVISKAGDYGKNKYLLRCAYDGFDKSNFFVLDIIEVENPYMHFSFKDVMWENDSNTKRVVKISCDEDGAVITMSRRSGPSDSFKMKDEKRIIYKFNKHSALEYNLDESSNRYLPNSPACIAVPQATI